VSVDLGSKTVMQELRLRDHAAAEVDGLHHAACGHDSQHRVEVWVSLDDSGIQAVGELLAMGHIHYEALQLSKMSLNAVQI